MHVHLEYIFQEIQIFQFFYNQGKNIFSSLTDHKNLIIFIFEKTDGQNPENTLVRKHFVLWFKKKNWVGYHVEREMEKPCCRSEGGSFSKMLVLLHELQPYYSPQWEPQMPHVHHFTGRKQMGSLGVC